MKKLFYALSLSVPMMFVACEPIEDDNNDQGGQQDGFWDVQCYMAYDSVPFTVCDTVISTVGNGTWEVVCDSTLNYDSLQNATWNVECKQVWVQGNGNQPNVTCHTEYQMILVQKCDSVWVPDNSGDTTIQDSTSTGVDNGNNQDSTNTWQNGNNSGNNNGNWNNDSTSGGWNNDSTSGQWGN